MEVLETKKCSKCKLSKSLNCFGKRTASKDGLRYDCGECRSKHRAKTDYKLEYLKYKNNIKSYQKQKKKNFTRSERTIFNKKKTLQKYGISLNEYNLLCNKQNHKCAICTIDSEILAVDHCHNSSNIRGLLCRKCNSGIGFLRDSEDLLQKALEYLREAEKRTAEILRESREK